MSLWNEFKSFALKGNVVDLAVGVIIGTAFGKIVSSLVSDIFMPPIGLLFSNIHFQDLKWILKDGQNGTQKISVNYGAFIQNIVEFTIIALIIFIIIKFLNRFKRKEEASVKLSMEEQLLIEIRDILKQQKT